MMERQVLVVSTGGNEGLNMVKGIRSAGVFCTMADIADLRIPAETKGFVVIGADREETPAGIAKLLETGLPILAFGAPSAALCAALGGQVTGHAISSQVKDVRFANLGVCAGVEGGMRMLESAEYLSLPQDCRTLSMAEGVILGFEDEAGRRIGFQFMPEAHDVEASEIIGNFLWQVLGLQPNFSAESYMDHAVASIREKVNDGQAVCVLSGGVDSATTACLAKRAVGDRLHCLVIDMGLARSGDIEFIHKVLGEQMGLDIRWINAQGRTMEQLRACITPRQKREAVSAFIGERIADEVARLGGHVVVVQGTNYPEVLQNSVQDAIPGDIPVVQPLLPLFKEEVRAVAKLLGVPDEVTKRQHYPSAGIALRCIGTVDAEKIGVLRRADELLRQTLEEAGQFKPSAQIFAVLANFTDAFGADRARYAIILRAVGGVADGSANVLRLPHDVLEQVSARILEQIPEVFRVVYDLSSIPPAKVEWE